MALSSMMAPTMACLLLLQFELGSKDGSANGLVKGIGKESLDGLVDGR
jgi:hypothetical protein